MSNDRQDALAGFSAVPQAARDARNFTNQVLDRWALSYLAETASLLVSELIANAVKHAGGILDSSDDPSEPSDEGPCVMLGLTVFDALRVEVWDSSSALPAPRTATDDQEDGRGLVLVEALSKEWGCELLESGGKVTWFVLDLWTS